MQCSNTAPSVSKLKCGWTGAGNCGNILFKHDISYLLSKLSYLSNRIDHLKDGINGIKCDRSSLESKLNCLKGDISSIKHNIKEINQFLLIGISFKRWDSCRWLKNNRANSSISQRGLNTPHIPLFPCLPEEQSEERPSLYSSEGLLFQPAHR